MSPGSLVSFRYLLLRCLLPSPTSIGWSTFFAGTIIGLHILSLSLDKGAFLPELFGPLSNQLVESYSTTIADPVDRALENEVLATAAVGIFWGIVGLLIYALLTFVVSAITDMRRDSEEIRVSAEGLVAYHPMRRSLLMRTIWRVVVGLLIPIVSVLLFPFIGDLLHRDVLVTEAHSFIEVAKQLVLATGGWLVVFHIYVVLIRLFVLRTRVFGEIIH